MVVGWGAGALFVLATAGWAVSVRRRDATLVDHLWGVAPVVLAVVCLALGEDVTARSWLAAAMVAVWGVRLSTHLVRRDRGRGEDWRHREARARSPRFAVRSLVELFWFQLVGGALVVGLPLFAVVRRGQDRLGWLDAVGVGVWLGGLVIESVADVQLARFRADERSRGTVLDRGLWRYSRHPNYFGDFVQWTGISLLGVAAGAWWAVLSPLMMLVILLVFSGVAVMDRHLRASRGAAYEEYMRRTSAFVPWPKRAAVSRRP